eukprot:gnl/MRDRNA2_/MRDRNA2_105239_c0_seq1.p1 gnl/MRDRNA2_/MRDRNA2_105239_c0~~gnl/MRDRNA2_/MRDRNA2_105239_c0_seq1.p1  ORF type:complete len:285 (+),score=92.82 gnl/MRDRNA2_/MRDRNA2_105239_c0_seq1:73-927(+)
MTSGELRPGVYMGKATDVTCPGDHINYEVVLYADGSGTLGCIPEMSYFKGGSPPWQAGGKYTQEGEDGEDGPGVRVKITKPDVIGPQKGDERFLPVTSEGALLFESCPVVWKSEPPVDEAKLAEEAKAREEEIKKKAEADVAAKNDEIEELRRQLAAAKAAAAAPTPAAAPAPTPAPAPAPAKASGGYGGGAKAAAPAAPPPAEAPAPAAASAPAVAEESGGPSHSLEELQDKKVCEKLGLNMAERETYLPDSKFQELFGMDKAAFAKLAKWKKDAAKKKHDLF